ncbi:MAG: hypothetical protein HQK96_07645 [Nitrospirae bacterium]|nr:hypothetical protein [Nitrospirota bacterium]
MAKFHKIEGDKESLYIFHCPGCGYGHHVRFKGEEPVWNVTGVEEDKPTVTPSLLVWQSRPEARCHSFIREGRIEFLSDCFRELKGKTVELPDFDKQ